MASSPYVLDSSVAQPPAQEIPSPSSELKGSAPGYSIIVRAGASEPRPTEILLGTLNRPGFRVLKPIKVLIGSDGETVTALWREADEFGTGDSVFDACEDLGHTVAELYLSLKADELRLGPDLQRVWHLLKEYVAPQR